MARVVWLTCRRYRGQTLPKGALPPADAQDFPILAAAAARVGIAFDIVAWDDPELPDHPCDAVLIRSTWDYHERSQAFLDRLRALEAGGRRVLNPSRVVTWNARKTYLQGLEAAGVPTIPTLWSEHLTATDVVRAFETFEAAEIVAKPQVGAGSRATIRLRRNSWSESDLALGPAGAAAMLQPFLPGIETTGEASLFWFGGALAHTIRKTPAPGSWFANVGDPDFRAGEATEAERAAAEAALAAAPDGMLYARVDLVMGPAGRPLVIEVEAIEPYLFLAFAPEGAPVFAAALARALAG